jgi:hypothetical protein
MGCRCRGTPGVGASRRRLGAVGGGGKGMTAPWSQKSESRSLAGWGATMGRLKRSLTSLA